MKYIKYIIYLIQWQIYTILLSIIPAALLISIVAAISDNSPYVKLIILTAVIYIAVSEIIAIYLDISLFKSNATRYIVFRDKVDKLFKRDKE